MSKAENIFPIPGDTLYLSSAQMTLGAFFKDCATGKLHVIAGSPYVAQRAAFISATPRSPHNEPVHFSNNQGKLETLGTFTNKFLAKTSPLRKLYGTISLTKNFADKIAPALKPLAHVKNHDNCGTMNRDIYLVSSGKKISAQITGTSTEGCTVRPDDDVRVRIAHGMECYMPVKHELFPGTPAYTMSDTLIGFVAETEGCVILLSCAHDFIDQQKKPIEFLRPKTITSPPADNWFEKLKLNLRT